MTTLNSTTLVREMTEDSISTAYCVENCDMIEMDVNEEPSAPIQVATAQEAWESFPSQVEGFGWSQDLLLELGRFLAVLRKTKRL